MSKLRTKLDSILPFVTKPQRYLGGEINSVVKDAATISARIAFVFPDLYEIGASNTGLSILYHVVNSNEKFAAERSYMPDFDMMKKMEENKIPLYSLESFTPLKEFSAIGFTLQYEMNYPNIPPLLKLAGIPVRRSDRGESDPVIIMGGPLSSNPMPMAGIADAIVVGDGEEAIVAILDVLSGNVTRSEKLKQLSIIEGVYVPKFPVKKFTRARIAELKNEYYPVKPLVPLIETVHLRSAVEVMRGCSRGCRFCAAGYHYRPVRERAPLDIVQQISDSISKEGWRDVSLLSLSTADYGSLGFVLDSCYNKARAARVSLSLPSTRIDKATEELFSRMDLSRRAGITFAPEAGSERLRTVINKNLTESEILGNIRIAVRAGYQVVKLYFMLGLPTETDEDIDAMAALILKAERILREFKGRRFMNVSVSPFSPKPGTPFEREPLITEQLWEQRIRRLRDGLRGSRADLSWGDAFTSRLETIFSRGGVELTDFIIEAAERGLLLQSWKEHFNGDGWRKLLADLLPDVSSYVDTIPSDKELPWDVLRTKEEAVYFAQERQKAFACEQTDDCRDNGCVADCGACNGKAKVETKKPPTVSELSRNENIRRTAVKNVAEPYFVIGLYEKGEKGRFIPHRDMTRLIERAFIIAGAKLCYSQGFSAHSDMSFTYPLSLGMTGKAERFAVAVEEPLPDGALKTINMALPEGIIIYWFKPVRKRISLEPQITSAKYRFMMGQFFNQASRSIDSFMKSSSCSVPVRTKSGDKLTDIRQLVNCVEIDGTDIIAELSLQQGAFMRSSDFMKFAMGLSDNELLSVMVERVCFLPEMK
jgi:radical SAM family uncharacterized protein/radical SAM-linked protein